MKIRLLDFLWCPACHGELGLSVTKDSGAEIEAGVLHCASCDRNFPIIRGIPRFLRDVRSENDLRATYAHSFGHQWTTYDWPRDIDAREFFSITDLGPTDLAGQTVLDAGCGGGRFLRFVAEHSGDIVGLDYSIAVEKAKALTAHRSNVHLIQADVNWHPLRPAAFDLVYSHGVLHHTPDTRAAFAKLTRLVKPGGTLYVAVFRKATAPLRWLDASWRAGLRRLPIRALDRVCGALSYLRFLPLASFWKRFFWFSLQPTHELRKCCLFDWYGPTYHQEHSVEEVWSWFQDSGYDSLQYINAWPYCPPADKYARPRWRDSLRLGQLLGMRGRRPLAAHGGTANNRGPVDGVGQAAA